MVIGADTVVVSVPMQGPTPPPQREPWLEPGLPSNVTLFPHVSPQAVLGLILEKPVDKQDAYRMLTRSGQRLHRVMSAPHFLLSPSQNNDVIQ